MYTEDYLLRMIRRLAEAVGRFLRGDAELGEVEGTLQECFGLSLATLDLLPAAALLGMLERGDTMGAQRVEAVADFLDALATRAPDHPRAATRWAKAAALRAAAG